MLSSIIVRRSSFLLSETSPPSLPLWFPSTCCSLAARCQAVASRHWVSLPSPAPTHTRPPKCMEPKSPLSKPLLGVKALIFTRHFPLLYLFVFMGLGVTTANPSMWLKSSVPGTEKLLGFVGCQRIWRGGGRAVLVMAGTRMPQRGPARVLSWSWHTAT